MATFTHETLSRLVTSLDNLHTPLNDPNRRASISSADFASFRLDHSAHRDADDEDDDDDDDEDHYKSSEEQISSNAHKLQSILHSFPPKPSRSDIQAIVNDLSPPHDGETARFVAPNPTQRVRTDAEEDELLLEWTVMARLVLSLYGETVEELVKRAGVWEDEIGWWKRLDARGRWSWRGIGGYLVQSEYLSGSST